MPGGTPDTPSPHGRTRSPGTCPCSHWCWRLPPPCYPPQIWTPQEQSLARHVSQLLITITIPGTASIENFMTDSPPIHYWLLTSRIAGHWHSHAQGGESSDNSCRQKVWLKSCVMYGMGSGRREKNWGPNFLTVGDIWVLDFQIVKIGIKLFYIMDTDITRKKKPFWHDTNEDKYKGRKTTNTIVTKY